ncbi:MAG: orotidine-5'-phosphate decarboxylase [Gammaproteobacteria bacterium]
MLTYQERGSLAKHPLAQDLLWLMEEKQSNVALSVDVTKGEHLLALAKQLGPHLCVLKTHIDIVEDFTPALTDELTALAQKHEFIIFEDRKFADIGNTVKHQYEGGIYRIADWAAITNAHLVPGPGIIEGLRHVGLEKKRGLLLLAEMSSQGTTAAGDYTQRAVEWAQHYDDFVMGFISLGKITELPHFLHMTPGIKLAGRNDVLKQQYVTPTIAIGERHTDVIIVGRGIYEADDPLAMVKAYQQAGWQAYLDR